jgi:hypothetical protein
MRRHPLRWLLKARTGLWKELRWLKPSNTFCPSPSWEKYRSITLHRRLCPWNVAREIWRHRPDHLWTRVSGSLS